MNDLVQRLRAVAPRQRQGVSNDFAFKMDGLSLRDLNALINEAADRIETLESRMKL